MIVVTRIIWKTTILELDPNERQKQNLNHNKQLTNKRILRAHCSHSLV